MPPINMLLQAQEYCHEVAIHVASWVAFQTAESAVVIVVLPGSTR